MSKIFGIDLGTTYSCIAYVDEYGKPVTVPNMENSPVTPSVVFFESPDSISVGEVAKQALQSDPGLVCSTIKRQMGSKDYAFMANGKEYRPEQVSSFILGKLAKDASEKLGEEVKDVVITCPAYFGIEERNATRTAGEIAGLNVLSIINEPTAAAISYGLKTDEAQTVMVYDLGGGTFDVTVIKVADGVIDVIATGGDHHLGGKDWDNELTNLAINQYTEQTGGSADDIYDDELAMGDLEVKCETAKKQLSSRENTSFRLNGAKIEVSRELFNTITSSLLGSTIDKTCETMKEAERKGVTRYDKILLVGGSTFMPQVRERLEKEFVGTPIEYCDPNEAVARGAAIYGQNLDAYERALKKAEETGQTVEEVIKNNTHEFMLPGGTKPTVVHNVISKSIAIDFWDEETKQAKFYNVIFKNTRVPLEKKMDCSTVEANQTSVQVNVAENNHPEGDKPKNEVPREDCTILVSGELGPLPDNLPAQAPLEIILKIDEEGLLAIDTRDCTGGKTMHMEVVLTNMMTEEEKQEAINEFKGMKIN